jgi:hypothetical protein
MKKNLVYYTLGIDSTYFEMFKLSIESLDKSNTEIIDVLVITDQKFYEQHFVNFERNNLHFHITRPIENTDQTCFNKLDVFNWNQINDYENLLLLDCDVVVNTKLKHIFDKCENPNKLYAPVEDMSFDNHRRIYFSLGDYTEDDINFFKLNNIHTFNSGTFMFKNSDVMKLHFNNIRRIIIGHKGDYFTEQSFMNYYFNKMKLVDYETLKSGENIIFVVQSNFYAIENFTDKIFHLIGNTHKGIEKIKKFTEFSERVFSSGKGENVINMDKNLIHIHKVTEDRKCFLFKSDVSMKCHLSVIAENTLVYGETLDLLKDETNWVSLDDGFLNKKIQFMNETFFQEFIFHGKSEFLKQYLTYHELKYRYSEFSKLYKDTNHDEYSSRKNYLDYYYEILINSCYKKHNILETEVQSLETPSFWKSVLPNSRLVLTSSDFSIVNSNDENEIYYFDKKYDKSLKLLFDNKNLYFDFDLIILKDIEILTQKNYINEFVSKLSLGGSIIIEGVNLDKIEEFETAKKKINNFEKNYLSEIICLKEKYNINSEIILKITKRI